MRPGYSTDYIVPIMRWHCVASSFMPATLVIDPPAEPTSAPSAVPIHVQATAPTAEPIAESIAEPALQAPPETWRRVRAPREGPLRDLLERLGRQPDLPSLAGSLRMVRRVARQEHSRLQLLAEAITRDVGASGRVLRLVNTAYYRSAGAGQITSIERAIQVLGYAEVVEMASGQRLVDDLARPHGQQLRREMLRAVLSGLLARELQPEPRFAPEAFLAGQFQHLGMLLLTQHLPEAAWQLRGSPIEAEMGVGVDAAAAHPAAERAAAALLGQGLNELGSDIARQWGWAPPLRHAMRWLQPGEPAAQSPVEQLRLVASLGSDLMPLLLGPPPASWPQACEQLIALRPEQTLCRADDLLGALGQVHLQLPELLGRLGIDDGHAARGQPAAPAGAAQPDATAPSEPEVASGKLLAGPPAEPAMAEQDRSDEQTPAEVHPEICPESCPERDSVIDAVAATAPQDQLALALEQATLALLAGTTAQQLLPQILEQLRQGLAARHAVLCLREPALPYLCPAYVFGPVDGAALACFRIELRAQADDLFNQVCRDDADRLLDDVTDAAATAAQRPPWHQHWLPRGSCLLLPLRVNARLLGLIYLDHGEPGALRWAEPVSSLVRALRNLAVLTLQIRLGGPVESAVPCPLVPS